MARWKLTAKHYLPVEGTEWEYKETDRNTGRQVRRVFEVPLYLDPDNPGDHTDRQEGIIVVSNGNGNMPRDIIFRGEPTPDMKPLDDEAEEISRACAAKWVHPIESLEGQGFSQSLLSTFEKQIAEVMAGKPTAQPVSVSGVDPKEFEAMKQQMAALIEQNAKLIAQLDSPLSPPAPSERRV